MTPQEYRQLRKVHRATGDVALGRLLLAYELRRRPSSPEEVRQLRLSCVEVYCDAFQARLTVAECVRRQEASEPSGAGRGFRLNPRCQACPLRDVHRAMIPSYVPPKFKRFNVARESKQRAARSKLWKAGVLDPVPSLDDPPAGGER